MEENKETIFAPQFGDGKLNLSGGREALEAIRAAVMHPADDEKAEYRPERMSEVAATVSHSGGFAVIGWRGVDVERITAKMRRARNSQSAARMVDMFAAIRRKLISRCIASRPSEGVTTRYCRDMSRAILIGQFIAAFRAGDTQGALKASGAAMGDGSAYRQLHHTLPHWRLLAASEESHRVFIPSQDFTLYLTAAKNTCPRLMMRNEGKVHDIYGTPLMSGERYYVCYGYGRKASDPTGPKTRTYRNLTLACAGRLESEGWRNARGFLEGKFAELEASNREKDDARNKRRAARLESLGVAFEKAPDGGPVPEYSKLAGGKFTLLRHAKASKFVTATRKPQQCIVTGRDIPIGSDAVSLSGFVAGVFSPFPTVFYVSFEGIVGLISRGEQFALELMEKLADDKEIERKHKSTQNVKKRSASNRYKRKPPGAKTVSPPRRMKEWG